MQANACKYVVGLAFTSTANAVVLIRKDHPEWQAGKLNGVGGKVEGGESVHQAMAREFEEEAGVSTSPDDWEEFLVLEGAEYSATFFRLFSDSVYGAAHTMTSEEIVGVSPNVGWVEPTIPNLRWIIPLGMDRHLATPLRVYDRAIAGAPATPHPHHFATLTPSPPPCGERVTR